MSAISTLERWWSGEGVCELILPYQYRHCADDRSGLGDRGHDDDNDPHEEQHHVAEDQCPFVDRAVLMKEVGKSGAQVVVVRQPTPDMAEVAI